MTEKRVLQPGPDHPITITPNPARVRVEVAGQVIADTTRSLSLKEASYPAVLYIPARGRGHGPAAADRPRQPIAPYKGDCSYFSIPAGGERSANAVWTYESPYPAVAAIKDHLAFYPDRVDVIG
ncbi:MAG: DUF427 domain-containing protein [Caulobacteraceae bacterium]